MNEPYYAPRRPIRELRNGELFLLALTLFAAGFVVGLVCCGWMQ